MPKNQKSIKDKSAHIRMPDRLKVSIEEEAAKNFRSFQDEAVMLIAEAVHARRFNVRNYT